eukprot:g1171.t1
MTSVGPLSSQSEGGLLPAVARSSTKSRRAIDERLDAKITNAKLRFNMERGGGEGNTPKHGLDKRRSVTIAALRRENSRRRSRNISLVALEQNLMESDEDEVDIESADTGDEAEDLIQYLRAKIRKTTVLGERRRSLGITIQAFGEESEESTKQSKRVVKFKRDLEVLTRNKVQVREILRKQRYPDPRKHIGHLVAKCRKEESSRERTKKQRESMKRSVTLTADRAERIAALEFDTLHGFAKLQTRQRYWITHVVLVYRSYTCMGLRMERVRNNRQQMTGAASNIQALWRGHFKQRMDSAVDEFTEVISPAMQWRWKLYIRCFSRRSAAKMARNFFRSFGRPTMAIAVEGFRADIIAMQNWVRNWIVVHFSRINAMTKRIAIAEEKVYARLIKEAEAQMNKIHELEVAAEKKEQQKEMELAREGIRAEREAEDVAFENMQASGMRRPSHAKPKASHKLHAGALEQGIVVSEAAMDGVEMRRRLSSSRGNAFDELTGGGGNGASPADEGRRRRSTSRRRSSAGSSSLLAARDASAAAARKEAKEAEEAGTEAVQGSDVKGLTREETERAKMREKAAEARRNSKMSSAQRARVAKRRECEARLAGLRSIGDAAIQAMLSRTATMDVSATSTGIASKARRLSKIAGGNTASSNGSGSSDGSFNPEGSLMDDFDRANLRVLESLQRAQQPVAQNHTALRRASRRGSGGGSGGGGGEAGRRSSKVKGSPDGNANRRSSRKGSAGASAGLLPTGELAAAKKKAADKASKALSKLSDDDANGVLPINIRLAMARRILRELREEHAEEAAPAYAAAMQEYMNPTHAPISVEQVRAFVGRDDEDGGGEEGGAARKGSVTGQDHAELLQKRAAKHARSSTDIHTRYNNAHGFGDQRDGGASVRLLQRRSQKSKAKEFAEMLLNTDAEKPRWPHFNPFLMLNRTQNKLVIAEVRKEIEVLVTAHMDGERLADRFAGRLKSVSEV